MSCKEANHTLMCHQIVSLSSPSFPQPPHLSQLQQRQHTQIHTLVGRRENIKNKQTENWLAEKNYRGADYIWPLASSALLSSLLPSPPFVCQLSSQPPLWEWLRSCSEFSPSIFICHSHGCWKEFLFRRHKKKKVRKDKRWKKVKQWKQENRVLMSVTRRWNSGSRTQINNNTK